jgi:hypothetical protein
VNHFENPDKKEAPAAGRGLESREETPKEGETENRIFHPLAKLCQWEIGRYLGLMAASSVDRAGGSYLSGHWRRLPSR